MTVGPSIAWNFCLKGNKKNEKWRETGSKPLYNEITRLRASHSFLSKLHSFISSRMIEIEVC